MTTEKKKTGGGKKREKKKKKIMMKIVATNVVASRPPEPPDLQRRPLVPKKSVDEQIFNSSQSTLITSIICLFELGHANGFNGDIA